MPGKKSYEPKTIEEKWRKYWEKEKIYKFDPKSKKQIYSIDTPPPYASSGHLHVGHALHYTQFEIIARIMRLLGKNVYFPPGYDDNGLPTEKYVEEKLGVNKNKVSREEFRKICLEESKKVEANYTEKVFKKLGQSFDWDLLYQTISPEAQKLSQTVFLRLVKKGDCYRSKEPVIWCTKHETALAQAEVEDLSRTTKLNYIDFDYDGGKINIATTRPEFLSSCVGIFINPKDKKNKKLIGKKIKVPIFNHEVNVYEDEEVDPEFGTGTMMVCTFGDTADIEKWKKHKLLLKTIVDEKGKMINSGKYDGLRLTEAREKIIEELKKQGKLTKQEKLEQTVGSCWRCNTPVEYLVTDQWFIKTLNYKKDLLKRGNQVKWAPKFMKTRFDNWVKGLAWDWAISRQRYYGIPIPVWYCEKCDRTIFPEERELPLDPLEVKKKCPKCGDEAKPDQDVFDTWMTSSNSPELSSKWLEKPELYKKIAPMSLRPQGHDIIRTWAFYTMLKSHLLFNRIPWKDLIISTFVLDSKGKAMHKSKGNAVWADDLIEKYNVDAFRYWVGTANLGSDLPFNEQELVAGKKFTTKLFNASKFSMMHLEKYKPKKQKLEEIDEYFLGKISEIVGEVKKNYSEYNIAKAKATIEHYFWNMFCDNYLEVIKDRLYNNKKGKESAKYVLYETLLAIIKIFSPICPFITEEIYSWKFAKDENKKSVHISDFPEIKLTKNKSLEKAGDLFLNLLQKVRKEKSEKAKSMNSEIVLTLPKDEQTKLKNMLDDFKSVTGAKEIKTGKFKVEFA